MRISARCTTNILIVDDDAALREGIAETVIDLGYAALTAADGLSALATMTGQRVDAVLLDLRMPGLDGLEVLARIRARPNAPPVAILTAVPTASNTIEAMRLGAVDHLAKPIARAELAELIERMLRPSPAQAAEARARTGERPAEREDLVGASAPMRAIQKTIGLLADSDATVLISGETGTGKEVVAQALHRHGRRRGGPFVAVNCAAIPAALLESELFGHVRGAFTGAIADRAGYFRDAHRGTLFLDEVGDMALPMQSKLLRALQERVVIPVGGGAAVPIDVRIVAASHRDLPAAIRDGRFREDLYYRLGVVPVVLPPLRERLADIVPLAEHFLALAAPAAPLQLAANAAALLLGHPWPGNVRELQNAMQRVTALVRGPVVEAANLGFLSPAAAVPVQDWLDGDLETAIARLEIAMIRRALAAAGGNRAEAARRLGIHRQMLHTKMRRLGLEASTIETRGVSNQDAGSDP